MPTPADLRNLGRDFELLLAKLVKAGIDFEFVDYEYNKPMITLQFSPMTLCNECGHLSPAAACLWCTPAEDADPGGHG